MIKRNSGFIIGCVLAAGASFFAADVVMSDQVLLKMPSTERTTETDAKKELAPEKAVERTYETDPFTVTASGSVVKGAETEAPKQTEPETEQPETDENGNVIESGDGTSGEGENAGDGGSGDGGSWDDSGSGDGGSGGDWDGSGSGDSGSGGSWDGSSGDGGSWDGSGSGDGSSGGSWQQPIVIQDPGNGDYNYSDGGSGGGSSNGGGSNGGSSNGGSSNSGGSGNEGAWTPDEVILWGISSRYIDESELYNYSAGQLRLIRNEIFALHGRIFRSQDLRDYFSQRSWYVPTYDPDEFDANMFYYLNDYEEANLKVILNYEAALAGN